MHHHHEETQRQPDRYQPCRALHQWHRGPAVQTMPSRQRHRHRGGAVTTPTGKTCGWRSRCSHYYATWRGRTLNRLPCAPVYAYLPWSPTRTYAPLRDLSARWCVAGRISCVGSQGREDDAAAAQPGTPATAAEAVALSRKPQPQPTRAAAASGSKTCGLPPMAGLGRRRRHPDNLHGRHRCCCCCCFCFGFCFCHCRQHRVGCESATCSFAVAAGSCRPPTLTSAAGGCCRVALLCC
jgi:hypothetical protein